MLFTCEENKREISLHKVIDEVNSGQGKKWEKRDHEIYWRVGILLEKTEKYKVGFIAT